MSNRAILQLIPQTHHIQQDDVLVLHLEPGMHPRDIRDAGPMTAGRPARHSIRRHFCFFNPGGELALISPFQVADRAQAIIRARNADWAKKG